jgi:hypothetical protein
VGQETVGAKDRGETIDPLFPNDSMEYYSRRRGVHKLQRLLIRATDDSPICLGPEPEPEGPVVMATSVSDVIERGIRATISVSVGTFSTEAKLDGDDLGTALLSSGKSYSAPRRNMACSCRTKCCLLLLIALCGLLLSQFIYVNCGEHGHPGVAQCRCDGGYSGDHCEGYDPCYSQDCGIGTCEAVNGNQTRCECGSSAYSGDHCENHDPCYGIDCGDHGSCSSGVCECGSPAYSGDRCENHDPCYGIDCGDHGSCHDGVCTCNDPAYSGDHCEIHDDCFRVTCGPHGSCHDGKCVCSGGYAGSQCLLNCAPHGQPNATGTGCDCNPGWSGDQCGTDPCAGYDCGHGTCHDNAQCRCDGGYSGDHCEVHDPCYGKNCGHGTCEVVDSKPPEQTRCVCNHFYTGSMCDAIVCVTCCGKDPVKGWFNECAGANCQQYPDQKCHCCGV